MQLIVNSLQLGVQKIRVLYVEDDPSLNKYIGHFLREDSRLELVASVTQISLKECETWAPLVDVAIIDQSLGRTHLNGTQIGLALRDFNPDIGIVIFSQHTLSHIFNNLPEKEKMGWSLIQKTGDLELEELVEASIMSARGYSVRKTVPSPGQDSVHSQNALSARQIRILDMAAIGLSNKAIAEQIGITEVSVRKDLSNSYSALGIPPSPDTDLRTSAILRRLLEVNEQS